MATPAHPAFDLVDTYVHLPDGPAATPVEVSEDFWAQIDSRTDLHDGRLVCIFHMTEDWTIWEMHPAGDEIVLLLSGAIDVVLEEREGERVVELRGRAGCVVPRGVWHRANIHAPSDVLHVTRGAGTQHRPV